MHPTKTVPVRGEISTHTYESMMLDVLLAEAIGKKIIIEITSMGGCSAAGRQMFDFLEPRKITTVGRGIIGSAGVLVFLAGSQRLITADASILLHKGSFTPETVDQRSELLETADHMYATIVSRKTGVLTTDEILDAMAETTTLNAKLAVRYGFAHAIFDQ